MVGWKWRAFHSCLLTGVKNEIQVIDKNVTSYLYIQMNLGSDQIILCQQPIELAKPEMVVSEDKA